MHIKTDVEVFAGGLIDDVDELNKFLRMLLRAQEATILAYLSPVNKAQDLIAIIDFLTFKPYPPRNPYLELLTEEMEDSGADKLHVYILVINSIKLAVACVEFQLAVELGRDKAYSGFANDRRRTLQQLCEALKVTFHDVALIDANLALQYENLLINAVLAV